MTYNLTEASTNLTSVKTAISAALTKLTAAISASRTTAATLQQSAGQEATKLQSVIDKANTDLASLNAKITSALAEINRLSATVGMAPTVRLLQTESTDDSDMLLTDNGGDVSTYSSGAKVDTDLKSSTTFTDESSVTNPSQQASNNSSLIKLSIAILLFVSAMMAF